MKNLAGDKDCDKYIKNELTRCRINIIEIEKENTEVPYTIMGRFGDLTFRRSWYYWVVKGKVPLDIAKELYNDPVGKTDIRVGGDCGCPNPESYYGITYLDKDGKDLAVDADYKQRKSFKQLIEIGHLEQKHFDAHHFVDSKEELEALTVESFIDTYHIDSEIGLRIFADALKKYKGRA